MVRPELRPDVRLANERGSLSVAGSSVRAAVSRARLLFVRLATGPSPIVEGEGCLAFLALRTRYPEARPMPAEVVLVALIHITKNSPGVYYEAGFAAGLGIEVIRTVRKDHLGDVHFDTSHVQHVVWETAEQLLKDLENQIVATAPPPS